LDISSLFSKVIFSAMIFGSQVLDSLYCRDDAICFIFGIGLSGSLTVVIIPNRSRQDPKIPAKGILIIILLCKDFSEALSWIITHIRSITFITPQDIQVKP